MDFSFKPADNEKNLLKKYGRNLTEDAFNGKIDPVIGRDEEIKRLIEILSRKSKNNPILIGQPGIGKTAIVEGFAQRIVNGDVPENLKDKELYELSLSSLISGAKYQGEFEERITNVLKQVKEADGRIIIFIDEIHQLVGLGRTGASGAMDAANILKPMMARGEIKIIGATTLDEYREHIEKDAALERRMQKIIVNEPTVQEALTIMRGLKEKWELFHQVKIHDSALVKAVTLSDRYISDRYLPDKAIDLIDEAAAKIKTQIHSIPENLDSLKREIIHKETERASLLKETDQNSIKRLSKINEELKELKDKEYREKEIWQKQKLEHDELNKFKADLDMLRTKVDKLQMDGKYVDASKILYFDIPELQRKIAEAEKKINENENRIADSVTESEVAQVISKATGIKLSRLLEDEKHKLVNLDKKLEERVKGQNEAVKLLSSAVIRGRAGINDPNRPIGSFLFMGPTGVGKTELSKALAFELFDTEKALIRIDMSEYMEKHEVSKLIGAAPGYVGYGEGGVLTEAVRRKPYAIILFDEIEKAHKDVLNILLQILDDGILHDSHGKLVNFKNTIIIMTTNVGAVEILENKKDEALTEIKKFLRPELLNRIDEVIMFNAIDEKTLEQIVGRLLEQLSKRLENEEIYINLENKKVFAKVVAESYDPVFGARPIKRYIQKHIENYLAEKIVSGQTKKNVKYELVLEKTGKFELKELKQD
ncbi:MAG: AAA family ATPase [Mycoplasmataceae bacterium]|nr:AAA family ATPase [Mycoplasmataceae bacterium]